MKNRVLNLLLFLNYDKLIALFISLYEQVKIKRYENICNCSITYISQGQGGLFLAGDLSKFSIDETSHLKSNTFIECSGGVEIGKYFHTGRGLTIFSTNHNYENATKIPYDEESKDRPVIIKDFVWCGSNVTIVPGVTVGEGVVIGAGSVITKDVANYSVVGGNPAKVIKYRNIKFFKQLKIKNMFY